MDLALGIKSDSCMPVRREDCDRYALIQTLERRKACYEKFTDILYNDYLFPVRKQAKSLYPCDWHYAMKVGDVVLVKLPLKPRPFWLLAKVLEIVTGQDSVIRSVKLQRADGQPEYHSICHLYPLQLNVGSNAAPAAINDGADENMNDNNSLTGVPGSSLQEPCQI